MAMQSAEETLEHFASTQRASFKHRVNIARRARAREQGGGSRQRRVIHRRSQSCRVSWNGLRRGQLWTFWLWWRESRPPCLSCQCRDNSPPRLLILPKSPWMPLSAIVGYSIVYLAKMVVGPGTTSVVVFLSARPPANTLPNGPTHPFDLTHSRRWVQRTTSASEDGSCLWDISTVVLVNSMAFH